MRIRIVFHVEDPTSADVIMARHSTEFELVDLEDVAIDPLVLASAVVKNGNAPGAEVYDQAKRARRVDDTLDAAFTVMRRYVADELRKWARR